MIGLKTEGFVEVASGIGETLLAGAHEAEVEPGGGGGGIKLSGAAELLFGF